MLVRERLGPAPVLLLLAALTATATAAEPDPLDEAWAALDAKDYYAVLRAAEGLTGPADACATLLLRGLAHEGRDSLDMAGSYLSVYYDLGCEVRGRQSQAIEAVLRMQRAKLRKAQLTAADKENATITEWYTREVRDPNDGSVQIVTARAYLVRGDREGNLARFEVMLTGRHKTEAAALVYNPPGAGWIRRTMRQKSDHVWGVDVRLKKEGKVVWFIEVTPVDFERIRGRERVFKFD
jgi:hypothetical protein